jgi:hypothetical protein
MPESVSLENTFGVIHLHRGSNNNPTVGQFVDGLKTSIIDGLAYTGLCNTNCEDDDDNELLDNLHSFLKESYSYPSNPPTRHGRETFDDGVIGPYIAERVLCKKNAVNVNLFSVAYVSGFIARLVLHAVRCDDCKACLIRSDVNQCFHIFQRIQK